MSSGRRGTKRAGSRNESDKNKRRHHEAVRDEKAVRPDDIQPVDAVQNIDEAPLAPVAPAVTVQNKKTDIKDKESEISEKAAEEVLSGKLDKSVLELFFEGLTHDKKITINDVEYANMAGFSPYLERVIQNKDKEALQGVVKALLFPAREARNDKDRRVQELPNEIEQSVQTTMQMLQAVGLIANRLRFSPGNPSGAGAVTPNAVLPGNLKAENEALGALGLVGMVARQYKFIEGDQFSDVQRSTKTIIAAIRDTQLTINSLMRFQGMLGRDQTRVLAQVTPFINLATSLALLASATLENAPPEQIYESVKRSFIYTVPYIMDAALRGGLTINAVGFISTGMARIPISGLVATPVVSLLRMVSSEIVHRIDLIEKEKAHEKSKGKLVNQSDAIVEAAAKADQFYESISASLKEMKPRDESIKEMLRECDQLRKAAAIKYKKELQELRVAAASTGADMQSLIKQRNVQRVIDAADMAINVVGMFVPPARLATIVTTSMNLSMRLFGDAMIEREAKGNFNLSVFDNSIILTDKASAISAVKRLPKTSEPNIVLMDPIAKAKYYKGQYNKVEKYHMRDNGKIVDDIFRQTKNLSHVLLALPHDMRPLNLVSIRKPGDDEPEQKGKFDKAMTKVVMSRPVRGTLAKIQIKSAYRKWMQNADILLELDRKLRAENDAYNYYANIRNYEDIKRVMKKAGDELIQGILAYQNANPYDKNNELYDQFRRNIQNRIDEKLVNLKPQPTIEELIKRIPYTAKRHAEIANHIKKRVSEVIGQVDAVKLIHDNLAINLDQFKAIANRMPMLEEFDRQVHEVRVFFDNFGEQLSIEQREKLQSEIAVMSDLVANLRGVIEGHDENIKKRKLELAQINKRRAASLVDKSSDTVQAAPGLTKATSGLQQKVTVDPGKYDLLDSTNVSNLVKAAMKQINDSPDRKEIYLMGFIPYDQKVDSETPTLKVLKDRMDGLIRSIRFISKLQNEIENQNQGFKIMNLAAVYHDLREQARLMMEKHRALLEQNIEKPLRPGLNTANELFSTAVMQSALVVDDLTHVLMKPIIINTEQRLRDELNKLGQIAGIRFRSEIDEMAKEHKDEVDKLFRRTDELSDKIAQAILAAQKNGDNAQFARLDYIFRELQRARALIPTRNSADLLQKVEQVNSEINKIADDFDEMSFRKDHRRGVKNASFMANLVAFGREIDKHNLLQLAAQGMRGYPQLRDVMHALAAFDLDNTPKDPEYEKAMNKIELAYKLMVIDKKPDNKGDTKTDKKAESKESVPEDPQAVLMLQMVKLLKNNSDGKCSSKEFHDEMQLIIARLSGLLLEKGIIIPDRQPAPTATLSSTSPSQYRDILVTLRESNTTLKDIKSMLSGLLDELKTSVKTSSTAPTTSASQKLSDEDVVIPEHQDDIEMQTLNSGHNPVPRG